MDIKGKEKFKLEVEKFVITRLRPLCSGHYSCYKGHNIRDYEESSVESRFRLMNKWCILHGTENKKSWAKLAAFPQLTNHEICQEMFWNAFRGRSKMYIQIKDLRVDEDVFPQRSDEFANSNRRNDEDENEVITLQCSLLTLQMLDYDIMMFRAMGYSGDEEYKEEAQKFYRPYLFSYVAEINRDKYERLKEAQRKTGIDMPDEEDGPAPYLWLECTFNPEKKDRSIDLDGYVVQSASSINKIRADLYILEDKKYPDATIKSILDGYELSKYCLKKDTPFIEAIKKNLGNNRLSTIDVYKIGNGNCAYAQGVDGNVGFFYDIGFNYRHRPQKIVPGVAYSYIDTMQEIYAKKPSFFILSHWDMDHIAGCAAAKKDFFDKDWFAPDCHDACIDAQRLAKYLDLKNHLFLAARRPRKGTFPGRLIGQINIKSNSASSKILATYRLYMGKKDKCDSSYPNCEGIVIEYTDKDKEKVVLMMGDVNYASFNKARVVRKHPLFADTQIDYLVVPHHGSEHTHYKQITDYGTTIKKGKTAIICCTNEDKKNRPNQEHRDELKKRFDENVITTEEASPGTNRIRICL